MNHDVMHFALLFFINGLLLSVFTCIAVLVSDMDTPKTHEGISLWAGISIFDLVVSGILFVAAHLTVGFQWVT